MPSTNLPPWLQPLLTRRMLICVITGFASGLPLYLLLNLVPAWLRTEGINLKTIGLFALIQFPYTWKFLWAPLAGQVLAAVAGPPPQLDAGHADSACSSSLPCSANSRRKAWSLRSIWTALLHLLLHPVTLAVSAVALLSATQDIALDAFRREVLTPTKSWAWATRFTSMPTALPA